MPSASVTCHCVLGSYLRGAHVYVDLVLLHQEADALGQPVGDLTAALDGYAVIQASGCRMKNRTPCRCSRSSVGDFGVLQQRFGRDAADVQAYAAQPLLINDGGFQTKLRGADGADVSAGAGADDDDIVIR